MEKIISFLIFILLVLFPFGQLTRIPIVFFNSPEIHLYLEDVIIGLLFLIWLIWKFSFKKRNQFLWPNLTKPMFLFVSICVLSLLINVKNYSLKETFISGLYLVRFLIYSSIYFIIIDFRKRFNYLKEKNILKLLLVIGIMTAIFGLIQYFLIPDMSPFDFFGWDPHYYRLVGTFFDPGFIGIIIVLTLLTLIVLTWNKIWRFKKEYFFIHFSLIILHLALALTYSRSSFLAYLVGIIIIALVKKSPKFLIIVLLIGFLVILNLPRHGGEGVKLERVASIKSRIGNWRQALLIVKDHPIFGVGFNTYRYAQRNHGFLNENWQKDLAGAGVASSLLFVLATTGLIGLIAYLWFWLRTIRWSLDNIRSSTGLIVLSSVGALLIHSWFLNSLFYPWVLIWLGFILALQ